MNGICNEPFHLEPSQLNQVPEEKEINVHLASLVAVYFDVIYLLCQVTNPKRVSQKKGISWIYVLKKLEN